LQRQVSSSACAAAEAIRNVCCSTGGVVIDTVVVEGGIECVRMLLLLRMLRSIRRRRASSLDSCHGRSWHGGCGIRHRESSVWLLRVGAVSFLVSPFSFTAPFSQPTAVEDGRSRIELGYNVE